MAAFGSIGQLPVAGTPAYVSAGVTVTPGTLALTITGYAPTVSTPRVCTPGTLALTITGYAPDVTVTANVPTPPPAGAVSSWSFGDSRGAAIFIDRDAYHEKKRPKKEEMVEEEAKENEEDDEESLMLMGAL